MHPVLFTIPGLDKDVHIYGVMIALASIMVAHFSTKEAIKKGLPADFFNDLVFWVLVAGIVGARLEYMRVNWSEFSGDMGAAVRIWEGGLVFYGGMIAALLAFWYVCRTRKVPVLLAFDLLIPYVPFGHALGRLGCFAAGCCYGGRTDSAMAVHFPIDSFPGRDQAAGFIRSDEGKLFMQDYYQGPVPGDSLQVFQDYLAHSALPIEAHGLHATQLYAVVYLTLLGFFFLWLKKRHTFPGQMLVAYLATYPILRSINEMFRGDAERGYFMGGPLSNAQFISLLIVAVAGIIWWNVGRKSKVASDAKG